MNNLITPLPVRRIAVGISGASGVAYGIKALQLLRDLNVETHLVVSDSAKLNIESETSYKAEDVAHMADFVHDHKNMAAPISSGSFITAGGPAGGFMLATKERE